MRYIIAMKIKINIIAVLIIVAVSVCCICGCSLRSETGMVVDKDDSYPIKTESFYYIHSYDGTELYVLNSTKESVAEYAATDRTGWIHAFDLEGRETEYETFFFPAPNSDAFSFSLYSKETKKYERGGMLNKGTYSAFWKLAKESSEDNPVMIVNTGSGWYAVLGDKAYSFDLWSGAGAFTSLPEPDLSKYTTEVQLLEREKPPTRNGQNAEEE